MAGSRRRNGERREPRFDDAPNADLRLSREDRPAGRGRSPKSAREAREPRSRPARRPRRRGLFGGLFRLALQLCLIGILAVGGLVAWYASHLPPIEDLAVPKRPPNIEIVDATGSILANRGDMGGAAVSLRELPPYVPAAFIAIEDRRFRSHFGVDPVGLARAVISNLLAGRLEQGGSTLTQQLAKNIFLTQDRTLERKVQEALLALWLERNYSKDQILSLYLNRVYFGAGAYGIEAASQRYFGKTARALTLPEAALLAGLVKAPSRLAPTRNPELAQRRASVVLAAMADMGVITQREATVAVAEPATTSHSTGASAVNYIADWVMDVLDDHVGAVERDIIVETTIDPLMQAAAETAVSTGLAERGDKLGISQGALVALSPDGSVRALIGGRSYVASQFNRAVSARRQPGSVFKPFVYLAAMEAGLTPDTVREDAPIAVKGWKPENYSREYRGPVTLRTALSQSLNTVAVRLALEVGPKTVVQTAQRLGIASPLQANPSIALGTSEVTPLELTAAYATFANGGYAVSPHIVREIRTVKGKVLFRRDAPPPPRVVDPASISAMNQMMRETVLSGTASRADLPGWAAAGKTGTSQDFRDAWFVGYTSKLVTTVWLGNDDGRSTKKATGGGLPVEIWSRFMRSALEGVPVATLPGKDRPTIARADDPIGQWIESTTQP